MLSIVCMVLPLAICLVLTAIFAVRKDKNATDRILVALCGCASVYFFAEVNYITQYEDYFTFVVADIMSQFARPMIAPLMVLCLHSMMSRLEMRWYYIAAFAVAVAVGTVSLCIYMMMGIENATAYLDVMDDNMGKVEGYEERIYVLYNIFCVWLYRCTNMVYSVVALCRIAYLIRTTKFRFRELGNFLFKGGEIEPAFLMSVLYMVVLGSVLLKLLLGRYFFVGHQAAAGLFCAIRALLVFVSGAVVLRHRAATVRMVDLRSGRSVDRTDDESSGTVAITDDETSGTVARVNYVDLCDVDSESVEHFAEIEERKMFLDPHVTIESVANRIGTNRTYLSKYINDKFGISFREYIGRLRIEYAKDYMVAHPDDKQEVVAEQCGFADAPQFNKKFKQIVGQSPRMWLAMQE